MKNIFSLLNQLISTDSSVKNIFFTGESVKRQITDSISENLTDLDLESRFIFVKSNVAMNKKKIAPTSSCCGYSKLIHSQAYTEKTV